MSEYFPSDYLHRYPLVSEHCYENYMRSEIFQSLSYPAFVSDIPNCMLQIFSPNSFLIVQCFASSRENRLSWFFSTRRRISDLPVNLCRQISLFSCSQHLNLSLKVFIITQVKVITTSPPKRTGFQIRTCSGLKKFVYCLFAPGQLETIIVKNDYSPETAFS